MDSSLPVQVCAPAATLLSAVAAGLAPCAPLTGVAAIDAGSYHTCALREAGAALCWGDNASGQLGDGTFDDSALPVRVCEMDPNVAGASTAGVPCTALSAASSVTAGGAHSCAVMVGNSLLCWGENSSGQLGDGTSFDRSAPVATCRGALTSTLTPTPSATPTPPAGSTACCSFASSGAPAGTLPCSLLGVAAASAGGEHTCAVTEGDGRLICWGKNLTGQLGDGTTFDDPLPAFVCSPGSVTAGVAAPCSALSGAATVSAGFAHTCARLQDGRVLCWGGNSAGKVGDSTTTDRSVPVEVVGFPAKPTPPRTATSTSAATNTPTRTPTTTNTPTSTPTAPAGPTNTPTNTPTRTPIATNTPTRTPIRTPTPVAGQLGDVNCDGQVNPIDAALILQLVAALIDSVRCPQSVDVNHDGAIDPIDAALILQRTAGLIPSL